VELAAASALQQCRGGQAFHAGVHSGLFGTRGHHNRARGQAGEQAHAATRTPEPAGSGRLEITLPNGAQIRVDGTVDAALLKAAIAAAYG
jgi:hypothetical protein